LSFLSQAHIFKTSWTIAYNNDLYL
jgi:hypothetical protein